MMKKLLPLILLSSCLKLQGPYHSPPPILSQHWKHASVENSEAPPLKQWWDLFKDANLETLIITALGNSQDVAAAIEKMQAAYYYARAQYSLLYPSISLEPSFIRQGSLLGLGALAGIGNGGAGANGAAAGGAAVGATANRIAFSQLQFPFSASWNIDLWGQLSQNFLSAYNLYEKNAHDYIGILNQISCDVAANYYLMRGYDTEIEILNQIIHSRQDNYDINQVRYEGGLINEADVSRAAVDLASARADLENVKRQRMIQENILALLLGMPAADLCLAFAPLDLEAKPPLIPISLPCQLIRQRPEITAAERNVASYHAQIGVAYANFFPALTLSGTLGYASAMASTLFEWQSRLWQYALNISQIIFDAGQRESQVKQSVANYKQAVAQYEQAILMGIREVEEALVNIAQRKAQEEDLKKTVKAAIETYNIFQNRYDSGLSNYLEVVIAERDLLNYSRSQAIVHSQTYVDTALLIKALGGGWLFEE